jgi:hypothetical protein
VCKVEGCTRVADGFSATNDLDRHIMSKHPSPAIGDELKPEMTHSNNSKVETATSEWQESFNEGQHLSRGFAKKGELMKSYPVPKNSNVDFYSREEELKRIIDYLNRPKSCEKLRIYSMGSP